MSRSIVLRTKHNLGIELAKQRISARFDTEMAAWIGRVGTATMEWIDDTAHVRAKVLAQVVTATVNVEEHDIAITIALPFIIAPFAGAIESFLKSNADALHPGKPSQS